MEKFDGGDVARGGFSLALSGLLGLRRSALRGVLRGGFYLGRYDKNVLVGGRKDGEVTYQGGAPREGWA